LKQVLAGIVVVALILNSYVVYDEYIGGGEGSDWLTQDDDGGGETLKDLTVVVPPHKLGGVATYDFDVLAEMYWEDYESGNWSLYRLTINGQLRHFYNSRTMQARDGFWETHTTYEFQLDTDANFELFFDANDADPLYIPGSLNADRNEYRDLTEDRIINTFTEGEVEIDRLPRFNKALTFDGYVDAFPNPNREVEDTLEEQIFGNGQKISLDDEGTVVQKEYYEEYDWWMETNYNWSADRAEMLRGYKTLRVNITSVFFEDFLNFNEKLWITSDSPFPIKRFTRTNQTWEDEGGIAWIIIQSNNTLVEKGFTAGDIDIPWGSCKSDHWNQRHDDGEYQDWKYIPESGNGFSASSFNFKTEEADEFARDNSPGLQKFLDKYDKPGRGVTVTSAGYNASKNAIDPKGKMGSYRWNLTYGYRPTQEEARDARDTGDYNFSYNIVLLKNITKDPSKPLSDYVETIEIENDWGLRRNSAAMYREQLPDDVLTLAASEDIMMKHPKVQDEVANRDGDIEWGDFETTYGLGLAGLGGSGPGFMMLELLTGIAFPSADYAWALQKATVYESGDTFSAAVDAENGQVIYVLKVSGTDLISVFG
jgi:hypothetical protein